MKMEKPKTIARNDCLLSRRDSALIIIDVQDKLLSVVARRDTIRWNLRRLAEGAKLLGVPVLATEQYPEKLGSTIDELQEYVGAVPSKLAFSGCGCEAFLEQLEALNVRKLLVAGIETHVCILQTVFDLLTAGYDVFVPVDAVGSRFDVDYETAVNRMNANGVNLVTTEMALFEWCERAGTDEFKQISQIVRQQQK